MNNELEMEIKIKTEMNRILEQKLRQMKEEEEQKTPEQMVDYNKKIMDILEWEDECLARIMESYDRVRGDNR